MRAERSTPIQPAQQGSPTEKARPTPDLRPGSNLVVSPAVPIPGRAAKITLQLVNADGRPISKLETLHTKPVHLIAVSEDLNDFIHVHPSAKGEGKFEVPVKFDTASRYRVWTEYQPKGARSATTDVTDIATAGAKPTSPLLVVDSSQPKVVGSTKVKLHGAANLKAGRLANLHFEFADSRTGQPAKLAPLLGAAGHAIVISSDRSSFMHLHGMSADEPMPSGGGGGGHGGHDMGGMGMQPASNKVAFEARFPKAGLYRVFAQVNRGGETVTVPFTVRVS